ncbi:hypothetical protein VTK56DRAFT_9720 [Thermocarpiscus australiensis]
MPDGISMVVRLKRPHPLGLQLRPRGDLQETKCLFKYHHARHLHHGITESGFWRETNLSNELLPSGRFSAVWVPGTEHHPRFRCMHVRCTRSRFETPAARPRPEWMWAWMRLEAHSRIQRSSSSFPTPVVFVAWLGKVTTSFPNKKKEKKATDKRSNTFLRAIVYYCVGNSRLADLHGPHTTL